jgi:hypothetical protein
VGCPMRPPGPLPEAATLASWPFDRRGLLAVCPTPTGLLAAHSVEQASRISYHHAPLLDP